MRVITSDDYQDNAGLGELIHRLRCNLRCLRLTYLALLLGISVVASKSLQPFFLDIWIHNSRVDESLAVGASPVALFSANVVFFLAMLIFLYGGGRISGSNQPAKWFNRVLPLGVYALMMNTLLLVLMLSFVEMIGAHQYTHFDKHWEFEDEFWRMVTVVLFLGPLAFYAGGWFWIRKMDQRESLTDLITHIVILAWVALTFALPIEIAAGQRHGVAPSPMSAAVLASIGILLWSLGPALFLLEVFKNEPRKRRSDGKNNEDPQPAYTPYVVATEEFGTQEDYPQDWSTEPGTAPLETPHSEQHYYEQEEHENG